MRIVRGLKESYKLANVHGIKVDLPVVHKANRAGIVLSICGFICLCMLWLASCAHASDDVYLSYIRQIESSNCKNMIGDNGQAVGCYQLHKGVVIDYNKKHKTQYTHAQMLDPNISMHVANWYLNTEIPRLLKHYGKPDTLENRLTAYNQGIGNVIKGKRAIVYINKYNKLKGQ